VSKSNQIGLLQVTVCLVGGWLLAQWAPLFQSEPAEESPRPAARDQGTAITRDIEELDFDERSILYAASRRMEVSAADRVSLKYGAWGERDPRAAIDAAFQHEPESERPGAVEAAVLAVAEQEAALALALSLPHLEDLVSNWDSAQMASGATTTIFEHYVQQDFAAAAQEVAELPDFMFKGSGIALSFSLTLGGETFEKPQLALVAATAVAARWPEDKMPEKVRWAAEIFVAEDDDRDLRKLVDAPMDGWDSARPGTAAEILAEVQLIEAPVARDQALMLTLYHADEEIGRQAVDLMSEERRGNGWSLLAQRVADPAAGIAIIAAHWDEIEALSETFLGKSPTDLLTLRDLPEKPVPTELFLQLPLEGQGHLIDLMVASDSLRDDPFGPDSEYVPSEDLVVFIDHLPPGEIKDVATRRLVSNWAGSNPEGVSTWIARLPAEADYRDAAVAGLVQAIAPEDPAAATRWAATIGDPARRERYLRVALRHWSVNVPATAEEAIRQADLPEAAAGSLLERLNTPDE
jgi:hypothetical protein